MFGSYLWLLGNKFSHTNKKESSEEASLKASQRVVLRELLHGLRAEATCTGYDGGCDRDSYFSAVAATDASVAAAHAAARAAVPDAPAVNPLYNNEAYTAAYRAYRNDHRFPHGAGDRCCAPYKCYHTGARFLCGWG
ncbi:hypothetical protein I4U23_011700 [Adineta vaga]|nr:hypothetical protein I4U23_011700 [Adineta vaga]